MAPSAVPSTGPAMGSPPLGYVALVLHAHLPFVRHPEYNDPIEERWLHEAITETYLPLLELMEGWEQARIDWHLTLSLSPPLVTMLRDELLQVRYQRYLARRLELAEHELTRTRWMPGQRAVAEHYAARLHALTAIYARRGCDLPAAFDVFARTGRLELLTSTATHAFLPLMQHQPAAVRAQVQLGADEYERHFGRRPAGLWNAECGYYPGLDSFFAEAGLRFFFTDSHGVLAASNRPCRGLFAPLVTPSGVAVFGRDIDTSREVWSAWEGYPGDPAYREFHRDIGYDLELDYIAPYIHESGLRLPTGHKYHRVTGRGGLETKDWYDPAAAADRARIHACDFVEKRVRQVLAWHAQGDAPPDRPPLITAPYDAELFGHWWYEGPQFLNHVMRLLADPQTRVAPLGPGRYLELWPENQAAVPAFSSWGEGGYGAVWLNERNRWVYPLLHRAAERMVELARTHRGAPAGPLRRLLNQMARELLLAQSSDWAFLITMNTAAEYGAARTHQHIANFDVLDIMLRGDAIDEPSLAALESQHNIFPTIDFGIFAQEQITARRTRP